MATKQSTVDYILEQLSGLKGIAARKMFGEYALYHDGKIVALICDDRFFIKPTMAGKAFIGSPTAAPPYPGAKPCYLIAGDLWEDQDWLSQLVAISAAELPKPKLKKKKT